MDKFNKFLMQNFDSTMNTVEFKPCAIYYHSMDYVEYLAVDDFTVSRRIDKFLTLVFDRAREKVVGFQLKGFECYVNDNLKPILEMSNSDFLSLVPVLEKAVLSLGNEVVDNNVKAAYKQAYNMAQNNSEFMFVDKPKLAA